MARRRRKADQAVSLFPFLSILACVIGTLTLMITALALGQMDTPAVASAEQFAAAERARDEALAAIQELQAQAQAAEQGASQQAKALAQLRALLKDLELKQKSLIDENKNLELPKVPPLDEAAHKRRLADLRKELESLRAQLKELMAELAKQDKPPEEAQVRIQPSGSGVDLKPTFVECTASGIVIYEGDKPTRVRRADLGRSEEYLTLLERIAKQPKATIIFLVREDGLGTYTTARSLARANYARNGKLPVIGQGKIDLSLFQN